MTTETAKINAFYLALDGVMDVPRRSRGNALMEVQGRMIAAKIPAAHYLWEKYDDVAASF